MDEWPKRLYGAVLGSCWHPGDAVRTHAHGTGFPAMATETHRKPIETFWHADGLNVQPERSKRFKTGFRRFVLEWADQTASMDLGGALVRMQASSQRFHFITLALGRALGRLASRPTLPLHYAKKKEPQKEGALKTVWDGWVMRPIWQFSKF